MQGRIAELAPKNAGKREIAAQWGNRYEAEVMFSVLLQHWQEPGWGFKQQYSSSCRHCRALLSWLALERKTYLLVNLSVAISIHLIHHQCYGFHGCRD